MKSKYKGINWSTRNQQWYGSVSHDKQTYYTGSSEDDRKAAILRDLFIARMNLPKNKLQILLPKKDK